MHPDKITQIASKNTFNMEKSEFMPQITVKAAASKMQILFAF